MIPFSVESPLSMIPTTESFGTAGAYPSQIVFRTGIEVLNSASGFASEESNSSGTFASGAYTPLSGGQEVITDSSDSPAQDQKSEPSYAVSYTHLDVYKRQRYDEAKPGTMKLIPSEKNIKVLKDDYEHMKNMIYGEKPDFDVILEAVKHLENEINTL